MQSREINLKQPTVSQFNQYPHDAFACFVTDFYMWFLTVCKIKISWVEYVEECKKVKAINDTFKILDRDLMAVAAGHPEFTCKDTTVNMAEKIDQLLDSGVPVIFSLSGGEHFESIDGRKAVAGVPCWTVDDPGGQGDKFCDCTTLEVFHLDANGNRVYSKNHAGGHRVITHIYWMVKR